MLWRVFSDLLPLSLAVSLRSTDAASLSRLQYHGDFHEGMPHGHGTHIFPDGSRVTGSFARGCPTGTALLRDQDELYHEVVYTENVSLLEQHVPISKMPTAQPAQLLYYCKYGGMCPMVALTIGVGIPIQNDSGKELLKGK